MLNVEHDGSAYGARLITQAPFRAGQEICRISAYRIVRRPNVQSIQIGRNRHLDDLGLLAYLNHSCLPNTLVNTEALLLCALRDIEAGEELTYFYPSTEWDMAQPFKCLCGAAECMGLVEGAKHLSEDVLGQYFINRHILEMLRIHRQTTSPSSR